MKRNCPCDIDGVCPYNAEYSRDCEYWCGQEEPEDYPEYEEYADLEMGFDPYMGCYSDDC